MDTVLTSSSLECMIGRGDLWLLTMSIGLLFLPGLYPTAFHRAVSWRDRSLLSSSPGQTLLCPLLPALRLLNPWSLEPRLALSFTFPTTLLVRGKSSTGHVPSGFSSTWRRKLYSVYSRNTFALLCCLSSRSCGHWSPPWGPRLVNVMLLLSIYRVSHPLQYIITDMFTYFMFVQIPLSELLFFLAFFDSTHLFTRWSLY